jgi:hypothetical protein
MRLEDGMKRRARDGGAMALRAAVLCLGLALVGRASAQDGAASAPSTGPAQAALLDYRETEFSLLRSSVSFTPQSAPFRKEPGLGQRGVHRGLMEFGTKCPALPMVWDSTQAKLYLDLNRNNDLADDPAGVFSTPSGGLYQVFTNVHLSSNTPQGARRELMDLNLYAYSGQLHITVATRSFWEGSILLQGEKWEVGFAQSPRGRPEAADEEYLVLRPWSERAQAFNLQDGSLAGFRVSRNLFFNERGYQLKKEWVKQGDQAGLRIELQEMPVRTGELKLTGEYIHRLLLKPSGTEDAYTVVLDSPGAVAKVPVGTYSESQVTLEQGIEAHQSLSSRGPDQSVVISAAKPALLACGGPLTNTVSATRYGRQLRLSYDLVGAGGRSYQLTYLDRSKPPQFAVYHGAREVASGKFEFG